MSEFQDIQRLIRLKRFETPGEDFVEDFVSQFREHQRGELLRQSARGLLWERLSTYFEHVVSPKWSTAATTAAVCVAGTWAGAGFFGSSPAPAPSFASLDAPRAIAPAVPHSFAVESPLMQEVAQSEDQELEIENILLSHHWQNDVEIPPNIRLAGVTGAAMPASGFFPVNDFSR